MIILSTFVFRHSKFGLLHPSDFVIIDRLWAAGVNCTMEFRRFAITLGLLAMAAFVYAGQTPSEAATGIEGVIAISPIKAGPVRADGPSSRPLANTAFVAENQKGEVAPFASGISTMALGNSARSNPPASPAAQCITRASRSPNKATWSFAPTQLASANAKTQNSRAAISSASSS